MAHSLPFSVRRQEAEVVAPASPTPCELKSLSDIDDQEGLRFELPLIIVYRNNHPSMAGAGAGPDPVKVMKEALSKALVFYYPLAGRIRERQDGKLIVECNGEGVLFVEADADVRVEQLGNALPPPPPIADELIYEVEGSGGVVNCPLLLVQVTRLMCGGFVLAIRFNHLMTDGYGMLLFFNALAEMARGADAPIVPPVWSRDLLSARTPPRVTCEHREYDEVNVTDEIAALVPPLFLFLDDDDDDNDLVHRCFFFGQREMAALRKHVPPHLRRSSAFEILAACLWRSRTIAMGTDPAEDVRLLSVVNARGKLQPALPAGYYGNVLAFPVALSSAGKLCRNPLGYALELVKKAKSAVTDEYMRSTADLMVLRGRPQLMLAGGYMVSDLTQLRPDGLDLGWAKVVYGGPAKSGPGPGPMAGFSSYFIWFRNSKGEDGITVPVCLPSAAMDIFALEVEILTTEPSQDLDTTSSLLFSDHGQGLSKL